MPRAAKPAILDLTLADSSPLRLTESSNRYYIEIKPIGCERIYRKLPVDVTTAWLLDQALSGFLTAVEAERIVSTDHQHSGERLVQTSCSDKPVEIGLPWLQ